MSQEVFSIPWIPEEVVSNVSEEKDLLTVTDTIKQRAFLPPCPLYRLLAKGLGHIRVGLLMTKDLD